MIVDVSDLYFHLEGQGGGRFLAGLSTPEEAPGFDFGYDGQEYFAEFVWPRLAHRSSSFERCGHVRGWSGLYAVTPRPKRHRRMHARDRKPLRGAFLTGRGVMQSFGIARVLSERIVEGRYGLCDLSPLGRERFEFPDRWLSETLHL